MSELKDLLRSAQSSYRTMRATIEISADERAEFAALKRMVERDPDSEGLRPRWWVFRLAVEVGELFKKVRSRRTLKNRIWVERNGRRRVERGDGRVEAWDGSRHWSHGPGSAAFVSEVAHPWGTVSYLADPAEITGAAELAPIGTDRIAGRPVVTARAVPGRSDDPDEIGLFEGYDAFEIAIDQERGVLLRLTKRIEGKTGADLRVVDVAFDEEFSDDLFELKLGPGERLTDFSKDLSRAEREVSLEEARRVLPFAPLVPPRGWHVRARVDSEEEPDDVALDFESGDRRVSAHESIEDRYWTTRLMMLATRLLFRFEPKTKIRRNGRTLSYDRAEGGDVELRWKGLEVQLTSDDLTRDELVALALSLEPFR